MKTSIFTLITAIICLIGFTPIHAQTCMIAEFPFNGNANDAIGSNHGTVIGASSSTDRFGDPASVYDFDGIDDYIDINNTLGNFGTGNFTISFWLQT